MIRPLSLLAAPRIHTQSAGHRWRRAAGEHEPPSGDITVMVCRRCGQDATVTRGKARGFILSAAGGCAGRRFTGRYLRGDHVAVGANRGVFDRYLPGGDWADVAVKGAPVGRTRLPVADLRPVLAARDGERGR